ncbi:MAG: glycosyl transferase family 1 [Massilia sp.]|nr:glycosyl transferase family 1 [Massilia sp.]
MRIVIDLDPAALAVDSTQLGVAREIVRSAGPHEVWVAFAGGTDAHYEQMQAAFSALLPRARIVAYQLPHAGGSWRRGAAAALREHFLAGLEPDLVYAPHDAPAGVAFASIGAIEHGAAPWPQLEAAAAQHQRAPAPARHRLAYVSPLPPQHSGIADYSAELVPELARFYDVELIVDQPEISGELAAGGYPVRQLAWFEEHGGEYDRVVYHFGNSGVHRHMFELIRRQRGVVVLHDFFLSGVLDNLENDGYLAQGYARAMYESHSYTGLADMQRNGRVASIWKYPLNKGVLDHAAGVVVHSEFSKQLARQWYGPQAAQHWCTVPLLRGLRHASTREAARERLGIAADQYLVCSFGMLGRTKLNAELLDAFLASKLGADPRCRLVFVGENDAGPYGAALTRTIAGSGAAGRIAMTGFVSAATYADYAAACDCAVQLRSHTRGETSAAVLDCLLHSAPTIVNAHGATAEIADDVLLKIDDTFSGAQLADALERLHADPALRARYAANARAFMLAEHAPANAGAAMAAAIEAAYARDPQRHYQRLLSTLGKLAGDAAERDLVEVAGAVAHNMPPPGSRQLFVDISALVQSDLRTGIQRVVRSVLLAMIADPPAGFRIEPVYSHGGNRGYLYARRFATEMVGAPALGLEDAPLELRRGDLFLGLDLFTNGTVQNDGCLHAMRRRGVEIYFVMYDLLPVLRPEVFPFGTERYFKEYIGTVAGVADGVVCISRAVADELSAWLQLHGPSRLAPLKIGYFHLGADIDASAPSTGLPANATQVFEAVAARPSFLMVGTVEPRKGQRQALAALELLWQRGVDANLVIVGKQGWMVDELAERMNAHPEKEQRLFWLPGVSDEMLLELYRRSAALLAASEGEGFGLPLIEAAQHGIPIIARDLPVFREVAGGHAVYFSGLEPDQLARALEDWLALHGDGKAPASTGMPWLTWSASAAQLLRAVVGQRWYLNLPGSNEPRQ